jgi:predicted transcriptional regulator
MTIYATKECATILCSSINVQVLQQLDQEGCTRVADMLRELPLSSVFVVGQAHSFVTEAFEKMDTVVKKDGYSIIHVTP